MTDHTHQTAPTQHIEAHGIRFAYRRFGKPNGAVSFSHDSTLSEGFKKIRRGFGLSVAQFDCDGGQVAVDFGS